MYDTKTEEQFLKEELLLEWSKLTTIEKKKWLAGLRASNNIPNKGDKNVKRN